jgi:Nucleotidyltransferase/DNA polymerase involved in DNA repair
LFSSTLVIALRTPRQAQEAATQGTPISPSVFYWVGCAVGHQPFLKVKVLSLQRMKQRTYIAIDLKSFYASVECVERGLDPLTTNLVVADKSRTDKTICLAVSPSLKTYGVGGRPRLFEVIQKVEEINRERKRRIGYTPFTDKSYYDPELKENPELELDYIVAPPRMAYYIQYSTRVYEVYLKYIAPEDIYPYSIDEVFIDATIISTAIR